MPKSKFLFDSVAFRELDLRESGVKYRQSLVKTPDMAAKCFGSRGENGYTDAAKRTPETLMAQTRRLIPKAIGLRRTRNEHNKYTFFIYFRSRPKQDAPDQFRFSRAYVPNELPLNSLMRLG